VRKDSNPPIEAQASDFESRVRATAAYGRAWFQKQWAQFRREDFHSLNASQKMLRILSNSPYSAPLRLEEGVQFVGFGSEQYPFELLALDPPPLGLFVRGDFNLEGLRFSVVGSRKPVSYSLRVTRQCVRLWVDADFRIVSGGAFGIDAEAHRAAVDFGGKTWVVMGSGFHHLYPKAHEKLFEDVLRTGGAWISEYPPKTEPHARFFPERNRLIAGLGHALFLAQAHQKSGSMITAKRALDLGRDIFVLRPPMGDLNFEGSQDLIQAGATALSVPEDWAAFYRPSAD
jgi:DNA protecting protein DprA